MSTHFNVINEKIWKQKDSKCTVHFWIYHIHSVFVENVKKSFLIVFYCIFIVAFLLVFIGARFQQINLHLPKALRILKYWNPFEYWFETGCMFHALDKQAPFTHLWKQSTDTESSGLSGPKPKKKNNWGTRSRNCCRQWSNKKA